MSAFADVGRVLFEPEAVFTRVAEKPRIWQPFVVLAVALVVIQVLLLPYAKAAMEPFYEQMAAQSPERAEQARKFAGLGVAFWPIIFALILLINAGLLWVLVSLVGGEAKFAQLLSVAAYVAVTFVLTQLVTLAIMMVKGKESVTSMGDLQPPIGLDLLIPAGGRFASYLLKGINPFSIWGVILTATGVRVTHRLSKGAAYTVAIAVSLILLLVGVFFAVTCTPKTS